jgi:hypothetical protein
VRSEDQVKEYWYSQSPDFSWALVRMGVMMLKSVGLSEYIHLLRANGSELDLLIVEFLGQHTAILQHLVPSPHNLFGTLADLTAKMVAFLLASLTLASFQLDL